MKNVKVYDCFFNNRDSSFRVRYFMISLVRTYIFNLDDDKTLYFRKYYANSRKMALVGKERTLLMKSGFKFNKCYFNKYNIRDIGNVIFEYVNDVNFYNESDFQDFDIVEKNNKKIFMVDSMVRKSYMDEIVTMCFDEDNKLFVGGLGSNKYFNNLNLNK